MLNIKELEKMVKYHVTKKYDNACLKYFMENSVKIRNDIVTVKGAPVYKIKHNYSSRKVHLGYAEITPTLIPIE